MICVCVVDSHLHHGNKNGNTHVVDSDLVFSCCDQATTRLYMHNTIDASARMTISHSVARQLPRTVVMPVVQVSVHPIGLHPIEAVKAWHKHTHEEMSLSDILAEGDIVNMKGDVPSRHALWSGIKRAADMGPHSCSLLIRMRTATGEGC